MKKRILTILAATSLLAFVYGGWFQANPAPPRKVAQQGAKIETAVFAGGCFWCVEANFEKVDGVIEVVSGYTGGRTPNPTYKEVSNQDTGHLEAVEITYDANQVSYKDLLQVFWRTIDPTDAGGSFVDRGESYTSAIFVADEVQRQLAEQSRSQLGESGRFETAIVTPVRDVERFYRAEEYHQDYYHTHPLKYKYYRYASGWDQFIADAWGDDATYQVVKLNGSNGNQYEWTDKPASNFVKPSDAALVQKLTKLQYKVTQHEGTERSFQNEFWNDKREGIYVDIVSGEPLFSSRDKFASGTGWPSFTQPLVKGNIKELVDRTLFSVRTEVRSRHADSHLGHVFKDGPEPTGLRYCINSAALKFIPVNDFEKAGYGHFSHLFDEGDRI